MKLTSLVAIALFLSGLIASNTSAQVTTGTPPFASFGGGPDAINLGNLNVHLDVPVRQKSGRGLDFTYDLTYDNSVWSPVSSTGAAVWTPTFNWGWAAQTQIATGFISFSTFHANCDTPPPIQQYITYSQFVYHDAFGGIHPFSGRLIYDPKSCSGLTSSVFPTGATDGSGLFLNVALNGSASPQTHTILMRNGQITNPPLNLTTGYSGTSATTTDRNGNQISVSSTSTSATYTDTTGNSVISVSGSASSTSPLVLSYTAPSGATSNFTVTYKSYTVATKFGCTAADYGPTANNLVDTITLPDGSTYRFTYEPTPTLPSDVTGRLASVTLPTGGTITYTYTGGSSGHITCADGSNSGLTRVTPDSATAWTYARAAGTGAAYTTTVTDPVPNTTVIQFQGIYETQRKTYQGSTSGTLLQTTNTCYNAAASPCTGTAITLPISQRDVYVTLGTQVAKHTTMYNSTYGMTTEQDDYDFGTGATGSLLKKQLIAYASLSNGIVSAPYQVTIQDGSGNTKAQTTYTYDVGSLTTTGAPQHVAIITGNRGNATTIARLVQGSSTLSTTNTYDDTGNVRIATDVNGAQTTYNYVSSASTCGYAFPSSVSVTQPLSMSRSFTWNCTGGVQTGLTDENNQTQSTTYNDPDFWRPASSTDEQSNVTSFSYGTNPTAVASVMTFNGGSSESQTGIGYDGLGRQMAVNHQHGPGVLSWDQVAQSYDALGRPYKTSMPCVSSGAYTCPGSAVTTTQYDGLSRPTQVTDGGGGTTKYTYANNDTLVTISPNPTGENVKQRQLEYDGLGRLTSVCEITSLPGSGQCNQTTSQTGYRTQYTYDAAGHLTQVSQSGQTRTYTYDLAGRLTSESNPETGGIVYTYDTDSGCGISTGDVVKRTDAVGNQVCFAYDALHRVTSILNYGPYASVTPDKFFVYDAATVNGTAMVNAKTRLAEAYTSTSSTGSPKVTDLVFSYTPRGEPSDLWQSSPHSGGYYHVTETYWANGTPNVLSASPYYMSWSVDGEGRPLSVTDGGGAHPVTGVTYNAASQPTQTTYTTSDTDSYAYDPNTGRMTQYKFTIGGTPQSVVGNLTWNANGTLNQLAITDPFNAANAQTCNYTHDDLVRIATANCGSAASQNFSYDAFGNLNKTGSPFGFSATYSSSSNQMTKIGTFTPTYDANGNVLNDSLHAYTWDTYGNSLTVDGVGLTYDALDRVVEQNRSGSFTQLLYSPNRIQDRKTDWHKRAGIVGASSRRRDGGILLGRFDPPSRLARQRPLHFRPLRAVDALRRRLCPLRRTLCPGRNDRAVFHR